MLQENNMQVSKRITCRLSPASFYISLSEQPHACARFLPFRRASMAPLAICGEMVLILTKEKQNKTKNSFAWSLHILWAHCICSALRVQCHAVLQAPNERLHFCFVLFFNRSKPAYLQILCELFPALIPCAHHKELWRWGWLPYICVFSSFGTAREDMWRRESIQLLTLGKY